MELVKRFSKNSVGRDFVVGDIHGMYDDLNKELAKVEFKPSVDRLFSVGDLADRGTGSAACIEWLKKPWFHAVRGNHEDFLIHSCTDNSLWVGGDHYIADNVWMRNGGEWIHSVPHEKIQEYCNAFQSLPYVIEIETKNGLVGIVHADIPSHFTSWTEFTNELKTGDEIILNTCMWSRGRVKSRRQQIIEGIDKIYCGHTIVSDYQILGNFYFIDTGAYLTEFGQSGHFTILEI